MKMRRILQRCTANSHFQSLSIFKKYYHFSTGTACDSTHPQQLLSMASNHFHTYRHFKITLASVICMGCACESLVHIQFKVYIPLRSQ